MQKPDELTLLALEDSRLARQMLVEERELLLELEKLVREWAKYAPIGLMPVLRKLDKWRADHA